MSINGVRHHGGTQNCGGQQYRIVACQRGHQTGNKSGGIHRRHQNTRDKTDGDDPDKADDDGLERAHTNFGVHRQHQQRHHTRDNATQRQRQIKQQVQRHRTTHDFGNIGGHRHQLTLQPVQQTTGS